MRINLAVAGLLAVAPGCYAGVSHQLGDDVDESAGQGTDASSGPGDGSDDGSGESGDGPDATSECDGAPISVGVTPMRRLTRTEYNNTVRDLLGDTSAPASLFSPDEVVGGFAANSVASLSKGQLDAYVAAAEALSATAVGANWGSLVACDPEDQPCLHSFVETFGRRAFRRPLSPTELEGYTDLLDETFDGADGTVAIEVVLQAMLLSPSFLYRVEGEDAGDGGLVAVTGYELASRLSYFLWASMPDDELLDLAAAGMLEDDATLEEQARRMLQDPRSRDALESFHLQWLSIEELEDRVKDPALFPEWDAELAQSMTQETLAFTEAVVRDGDGRLETLLTASWSVIDADLAELYGVEPNGAGFSRTELDPSERSGILTHASVLAGSAHAAENSWVYRGLFVREKLLCDELPPPPAGVDTNNTNDPGRLDAPECAGCHILLDPLGQGFDAYSPVGTFRVTDESGESVDGAGSVTDISEIGDFVGPVELGEGLSTHRRVLDCVATQWFRYATRRHEADADACALEELQARFDASDGDIRELAVSLVTSPSFRFRSHD